MNRSDAKPARVRGRRRSRAAWATAVGLCLVAGGALGGPVGGSARADDIDAQKDRVNSALDASRAKLANLSAAAQEAVVALQKTQANIAAAQAALATAQAQEKAAADRKTKIDADLVKAKKDEADGLARIAAIKKEQDKNTDLRDNIARRAYEGTGLERFAAVLNTDKAKDLADNIYVVEKVNDNQHAVLTELAAQKAKADAEQAKLAEARRQIASLQLQAQAAVAQAADARAAADKSKSQLVTLEAEQKKAAAAVAAQKGDEEKRVAQLQAESDSIAAQLAARFGQPSTSAGAWSGGSGQFALPVNGPTTSEFEWRINPILGTRELHSGLDLGVPCGTPVHASGDGTVVHAAVTGGYGNSVWIDHGGGIVTTYNHMEKYATTDGASVKRGDVIGYVGSTGLSTGCHMHWEVRVGGTPVNPRGWF